MRKVLFVGLSPGFQKTMLFDCFAVGEVSRSKKYWLDVSGKCVNSARVFAQLGGKPDCLAQIGKYDNELFVRMAHGDGINFIPIPTNVPTRYCYTIVDESIHTATELVVNESEEIDPEVEENLFKKYCEIVDSCCAVVVNGSRLPGFSNNIIPEMVTAAKNRGKLFFADYRKEDLKNSLICRTIRPDYIKINMDEFRETFTENISDIEDIKSKLRELTEYYNNTIIITQGADETIFAESGKINYILPVQVKPINPIGCGDAFLAGMVMGIINKKNLKKAIDLGIECARKNVLNIRPGNIK